MLSIINNYKSKHFFTSTRFLYLIFFAWFSITGPLQPLGNWDMLAYVGAALKLTGQNDELRSRSLAEIQKYVSAKQYNKIIGLSEEDLSAHRTYRMAVAKDDKAFIEQLPAYLVKPLYVLLTGLLGTAIGNIALASVLVSAVGFSMMGVSLYLLRPAGLHGSFWLTSVLGVLYFGSPQLILLPKAATPDSLATGFMLMGFWAYLENKRSDLPIVLMCIGILVRPDYVITILCLFPLFIKFRLDGIINNKWLLRQTMIPLGIYFISTTLFPGFGLMKLIIFIEKGPFPYISSIDTTQFKQIYFSILYNDYRSLINLLRVDVFFIASFILLLFSKNPYAKLIVIAALGNFLLKVLLFPNFDSGYQERYLFVSYFLVLFSAFNWQAKPSFIDFDRSQASV